MAVISESLATGNFTGEVLSFDWGTNRSIDDFKQELLTEAEVVAGQKAEKVLINIRNYRRQARPSLDNWIRSEFSQKLATAGVRKLALLTDKNYISRPADQDPMQDNRPKRMLTGYFDRADYALAWLGL